MFQRRLSIAAVLVMAITDSIGGGEPSTAELDFFESKIRPVLVEHCYACHSTDTADESGLRVDDAEALREGGSRGPAVVPGKPAASLLFSAMSHQDQDLQMPPDAGKLPENVIASFRHWIEIGAPDPRTTRKAGSPGKAGWSEAGSSSSEHWAYQPPTWHSAPSVTATDWPRDPIDRHVLAGLERAKLSPTNDADLETFLRRLHFDLIGLPPSPADLERFQYACMRVGERAAITNEVDRLLATPQYGERWGRHLLDVFRFGESTGNESNISFPHAWRYRDYVFDSIAADLPIDRFLTEQLAGDLLSADSAAERKRLLIATGFLAVGTKNLDTNDDRQFEADVIDEQIDTVSRAILASSIACARCHDHKFDPFTMRDYYGLAGVFASTKTYFGTFASPANNRGGDVLPLPRTKNEVILHRGITKQKARLLQQEWDELLAERNAMDAARKMAFAGKKPDKTFTIRDALRNLWRSGAVKGQLQVIDDATGKPIPVAMGVKDSESIVDAPLLARGEVRRAGEPVPRKLPDVIAGPHPPLIPRDESGRLQLAAWLTSRHHPLTGRVFVNRVWQHLFGTGLVATVDDFGVRGARPSHPDLLDSLATDFMSRGWSLKSLVRRLVLTRTYRQASTFDSDAFMADPDNRLLWRMPKRRLEAEAIRDAMLVASGELEFDRPKGSLVATEIGARPISLIGLNKKLPKDLDGARYRSAYLPVVRDRLPDVLDLFDFAEPSLVTGRRDPTNVPVQALYLMNSPWVQARAAAFANRLVADCNTKEDCVRRAYRVALCRQPSAAELRRCLRLLLRRDLRKEGANRELELLCQALFAAGEFRNLD